MVRGTGSPVDPDALVDEYALYDRSVDIVSIYDWLFTETRHLPPTVAHFERYPRIRHSDGQACTPDFTVLFTDGTGIVAEVANIALNDESVDKLCRQLARYATLTDLPVANGTTAPVTVVDVLYLSPIRITGAAVRRVLVERLDDPDHWYSSPRRPVIVQFAQEPDRYVFQIYPDAALNGSLHVGDRTEKAANYGLWHEELNATPAHFAANKVEHAFMNDPVPPLYMATRLWANVFPSAYGTDMAEVTVNAAEVAALVRGQYGHGTTDDVRAALNMLAAAGLATPDKTGNTWTVRRRNLRHDGPDVHRAIADRIGAAPASRVRQAGVAPVVRGRRAPDHGQGTLFDT